jgi:hypothetical protein
VERPSSPAALQPQQNAVSSTRGDPGQVDGLDEFRRIAEEARCQIELWDLEPEIRPLEEALPLVRPGNPRPDRYGA